jgi:hypothetical protein
MLGTRRSRPVLRKICTSTIFCTQVWGNYGRLGKSSTVLLEDAEAQVPDGTMSEDHSEIFITSRQRLRGKAPRLNYSK